MSEKVKLTREQYKDVDEFISAYRTMEKDITVPFKLLADAIKYGYEVEPEYRVGNWVVFQSRLYDEPVTRLIVSVSINGYTDDIDSVVMPITRIRHATESEIAQEKERRWWSKHGRGINEYKAGDLFKHGSRIFEITNFVEGTDYPIKFIDDDGEVNGIHKHAKVKIICFAENRLDRSGEE